MEVGSSAGHSLTTWATVEAASAGEEDESTVEAEEGSAAAAVVAEAAAGEEAAAELAAAAAAEEEEAKRTEPRLPAGRHRAPRASAAASGDDAAEGEDPLLAARTELKLRGALGEAAAAAAVRRASVSALRCVALVRILRANACCMEKLWRERVSVRIAKQRE